MLLTVQIKKTGPFKSRLIEKCAEEAFFFIRLHVIITCGKKPSISCLDGASVDVFRLEPPSSADSVDLESLSCFAD